MRIGFRGAWLGLAAIAGIAVCDRTRAAGPPAPKRFSLVYSIHNHGYVEPCG